MPMTLQFCCGCQYIVSRENILNRPKRFYEYIYNMICNSQILTVEEAHYGNNMFNINEINLFTLERLFFYIYDTNTKLSNLLTVILNNQL